MLVSVILASTEGRPGGWTGILALLKLMFHDIEVELFGKTSAWHENDRRRARSSFRLQCLQDASSKAFVTRPDNFRFLVNPQNRKYDCQEQKELKDILKRKDHEIE